MDGSDPLANYHAIREELRRYDEDMAARPEIVALTKADLPMAEEVRAQFETHLGRPVLLISAVTGRGLNQFTEQVLRALDQQRSQAET